MRTTVAGVRHWGYRLRALSWAWLCTLGALLGGVADADVAVPGAAEEWR